jgi:hypothetical protein
VVFRRSREEQQEVGEDEEKKQQNTPSSSAASSSSQDYQVEQQRREMSDNLYMAVVRIQASQNIADWKRACDRAAVLLGESANKFEKLVVDEARKRYNRIFMKQLNEAKKTIEKRVREKEDNFRVVCKICGEPIYFSSSSDEKWEEGQVKQALAKAFENWAHRTCLDKSGKTQ